MSARQEAFNFSAEVSGHSLPAPTGSAVYVDECVWPFGRMMMCHMLADRVEDLHAMADKIGIARRWFQNKRYPHYDICKSKRALAVKLGAIEIDRQQFVTIARRVMNPPNREVSQDAGGKDNDAK